MALDVSVPDSPPQSGSWPRGAYNSVSPPETGATDEYHRDELEGMLEDGVWADGFEEWAAGTTITETEFALLVRHGLIERLDFYWDPVTDEVCYRVPDLPDDTREALAAGTDADEVESELDSLARTVSATLENEYRSHNGEAFGSVADEA